MPSHRQRPGVQAPGLMGKRLVPGVCLVDTPGTGAGTPAWKHRSIRRDLDVSPSLVGTHNVPALDDLPEEVTAACFNNSRLCSTQPPVLPSTALQKAVVTLTAHSIQRLSPFRA